MKAPRSPFHSPAAFTLMELLVVMALIAILTGMIFAAVGSSRRKADGIRCTHNLRQLGAAFAAYAGDNNGAFPPNVEQKVNEEENDTVWSAVLVNRHYLSVPTGKESAVFLCPFDPGASDLYSEAYRSYAYNPGSDDELKEARSVSVDGLGHTILLAEWFEPDPYAPTDIHPVWDSEGWSIRVSGGLYKHHPDGTSGVLFYDLHVENVKSCPNLPNPETPAKWTFDTK